MNVNLSQLSLEDLENELAKDGVVKPEGYEDRLDRPEYDEGDVAYDAVAARKLAEISGLDEQAAVDAFVAQAADETLVAIDESEQEQEYTTAEKNGIRAFVGLPPLEDDDDEPGFALDLADLPAEPSAGVSRPNEGVDEGILIRRLEELLEPYSLDSTAKAAKLLRGGKITLAKRDGQSSWWDVQGSTLYVVKITHGEDFLFAECSCPNGMHRGGDAICYHSIAARVADADLSEVWLEGD